MDLVPKRNFRLGQVDSKIISEAARGIVREADPVVRRIVSEERARAANSLKEVLPFAGLSAATALGAAYLVPPSFGAVKTIGYVASAGLLGVGVWRALDEYSQGVEPAPTTTGSDPLAALVKPYADQLAKSVVAEAEPRVREIVRDEKLHLAEAAKTGLPWAGLSTAAFLATAFLVPDSNPVAKMAGYGAAAALLIGGAWGALGKVA